MTRGIGMGVAVIGLLAAGCSANARVVRPLTAPTPRASAITSVALGAAQSVSIASSFGPGQGDVQATITVLRVVDHVAPGKAIAPIVPASHWASAQVEICPKEPVILGYPAWVLGDDSGRTAQVTRVLHAQFPQPALRNGTTLTRCTRGWVTWVTPNDLKPTKVTFEQAYDVPDAWRLS